MTVSNSCNRDIVISRSLVDCLDSGEEYELFECYSSEGKQIRLGLLV